MMSTNIRVEDKRRGGIVGCADERWSGLHPGLSVCLFDLCHHNFIADQKQNHLLKLNKSQITARNKHAENQRTQDENDHDEMQNGEERRRG